MNNEITYDYILLKEIALKFKIFIILIVIIIYFSSIYKITSYYNGVCTIKDNICTFTVFIEDIHLITKNNKLSVDNVIYEYSLINISEEIPISHEVIMKEINIEINFDKNNKVENNYIKFKIKQKKQSVIYFIIDYIKGG